MSQASSSAVPLTSQQFAHLTAHELKGPLRKLALRAGLSAEVALAEPETAYQALKTIEADSQRLLKLVDALLSLAALEHSIGLVSCDAKQTIHYALQAHQEQLKEVKIAWSEQDRWPAVMANAVLLEQVWSNLIKNAYLYRDGTRPLRLQFDAVVQESRLQMSLKDTAQGFRSEQMLTAFQPYQRFHDGLEGHGLGLAFCQQAIRAMRGTIHLSSVLGEGSCFTLSLPLAA